MGRVSHHRGSGLTIVEADKELIESCASLQLIGVATMSDVVSIEGLVELKGGRLTLRIPLSEVGDKLARLTN
jgi:hypothetical protein